MPPYHKHLETSTKRTGKSYQEMHDWLDNHPQMKADRHDLDKLPENIKFAKISWGDAAVKEYLQHIVEDAAMQDIETLKKAGVPEEAISHSIEVSRKALEISSRVKINVDKVVDIYTDDIVPNTDEKYAEEHFVEILQQYEKYGKNPVTLKRYINMHQEIHGWMAIEK